MLSDISTYSRDQKLLEYGATYYPEIRFNYGPICWENRAGYLSMLDKLFELWLVDNKGMKI